jgi:transcriptional regulator with XRE-family HTH domain
MTVSRWERGATTPDFDALALIAEATGKEMGYFLAQEENTSEGSRLSEAAERLEAAAERLEAAAERIAAQGDRISAELAELRAELARLR